MGRVMQEMTRSDGTTISLIERESGWAVVLSNDSGYLSDKNFKSYSQAELYARTISRMPTNEELPWESLVTSVSPDLK